MATKKTAKPATAKKTYSIDKKRSGRYSVIGANGKYINGPAKTEILVKEGLVKTGLPKKAEEAPAVAEAPAADAPAAT